MIEEPGKKRDPYPLRAGIVSTIVVIFLFVVVVKLAAIQLFDSEKLRGYADSQGMRSEDILPERGLILDRNERILANNIIEYTVGARYIDLQEPENAFTVLADAFDKTPAYYRDQFKKESNFYILETNVRPGIAERLQNDPRCHGLKYDKKMSRIYPYGDAAGQLLGFLWNDGSGQAGIEKYYDKVLRGEKGVRVIQRDKRGEVIAAYGNTKSRPAVPGGNVQLTIDIDYQIILEEELARTVRKSKGKSGMAMIMDPGKGQVLAIANYPPFDPNRIRNSTAEIRKNRVITDQFEPGSVMKFVPAAAAFENNIFSPTSRIFCENGDWKVRDRIIHDTKPHEWLTVEEIITLSSNIGAGKIAHQVGDRALYETARKFGFGEATAVGLWGESNGVLRTPDQWSGVGFSQIAMGHGVTVTLIQLVNAYSAIANGGTLLKPYIVSTLFNERGKVTRESSASPVRRVISKETSATLRSILEEAVKSGTGTRAYIDDYHVAGKTGTAQKVVDGKYSNSKYYATFVGFFPANDPVLVCGMVVDEPAYGLHHGGTSAAPAVKEVFSRIINTPDFNTIYKALPKPEAKSGKIAEQKHTDAGDRLLLSMLHRRQNTPAFTEKDENNAGNAAAGASAQIPPEDKDEYDIIMPDVGGMHILQAKGMLEEIGLRVEAAAKRGKVRYQYPAPGTYLRERSLCRLEVHK